MTRKKIGLGVAVFTLVIAAIFGSAFVKQSNSSSSSLQTVSLEKGDLVLSVPATGVTEALFSVEVKSKASGEIRKILAEEGDVIHKGHVLVEIDPRIEEIGVRRSEADLMASQARLKKAEILLKKARLAKSRKKKLHLKGFISNEEHEESLQDVALQEADLMLAKAELIRAEESLSEAIERLKETEVISPLSGIVLSLNVQRGQLISSGTSSFSQGTSLAVIGDLSQLQIRAEVDETDARKIAVGQEALIRFDAFPDQSYPSKVIRIAPLARMKNDLAVVEVILSLQKRKSSSGELMTLRPGLSADVEIITHRHTDIPLLAREVVYKKEGKWGVSLVQGETVSFHEVTIGVSDGDQIEIKSDLPMGTKIAMRQERSAGSASRGRPRGRP